MNDKRNITKTLSTLTLLVVGSAAGAAMAGTSTDSNVSAELDAAVSMTTLQDLALDGFYQSAQAANLLAVADGHHDDSIFSHHHHAVVSEDVDTDSANGSGRFDV